MSKRGQALIESVILLSVIITMLLGSYIIGKILTSKQNSVLFTRAVAFKDTYGNNKFTNTQVKSSVTKDTNANFLLEKRSAGSGSKSGSLGFLDKIFNFISSTKVSKVNGNYNLENYLLKSIEASRNIKIKDELYMDEGTFSHSTKLRLLLYGLAFVRAGFANNTKIEDLGQDYLKEAEVLNEKENVVFE